MKFIFVNFRNSNEIKLNLINAGIDAIVHGFRNEKQILVAAWQCWFLVVHR